MPYKKRSYYKHEEAKARDYSLFVIACEGTKTEPSYILHRSIISNVSRLESWSISKLSLPLHMYWHQRKSI